MPSRRHAAACYPWRMGGSGSGDWQCGRTLTVQRPRLDVRAAVRAGLELAAPADDGRTFNGYRDALACLTLEAIAGADVRADAVTVTTADGARDVLAVLWTLAGYGWRPWWQCPACRRRAAILYAAGPWRLDGWACRHCHRLAYLSTRQRADVRADAALRRAAAALGVTLAPSGGWAHGMIARRATPPRPPGMRRDTYARRLAALWTAHDAASDAWLAAFMGSSTARRYLATARDVPTEATHIRSAKPTAARGGPHGRLR